MNIFTVRLTPGQDVRDELLKFAADNNIAAGFVITCVGSLSTVTLRMAGAKPEKQDIRVYEEMVEVVSLVGTFSAEDCHLHMSFSRSDGTVIGGHIKQGSRVHTTAEIVIAHDERHVYNRELDEATGFPELSIKKVNDATV